MYRDVAHLGVSPFIVMTKTLYKIWFPPTSNIITINNSQKKRRGYRDVYTFESNAPHGWAATTTRSMKKEKHTKHFYYKNKEDNGEFSNLRCEIIGLESDH